MKKNKSEVVIVLDRSGSMATIRSDVEGGFKTFIDKQKKQPGECFVSLYKFNTTYNRVFENKDIQTVEDLILEPSGNTALLDALGQTIKNVGLRLARTVETERPETVIILVLTDGEENASREFSKRQIKEMIEHQTAKYNWHFVFVGSNQDAILAGESYGIAGASSLSFANSTKGISNTFAILGTGVACMRVSNTAYAFSADERTLAMVDDS